MERQVLLSLVETNEEVAVALIMAAKGVPGFNWNWRDENQTNDSIWGAALCMSYRSRVVPLLLSEPSLDPNSTHWFCPLWAVSFYRDWDLLRMLLDDFRVDANKGYPSVQNLGSSTVWHDRLCFLPMTILMREHIAADLVIASLRRLRTPANLATLCPPVPHNYWIELVESYLSEPFYAIQRARKRLADSQAMHLEHYGPLQTFLFVILLQDGYYVLPEGGTGKPSWFFICMLMLPMELQMIICNRIHGLSRKNILAKDVNWGLKIYVADGWLDRE